jgi:Cytochrome c7 and related cytochrome c
MKILDVLLMVLLVPVLAGGCSSSKTYTQPIAYNHKKHIEDAGLGCFDCHTRVQAHPKASIPNIEICQNCHDEPMTDSKEEAKVVDYIKKHQPIPWVQVHRVPDYAYFSHARHVSLGKIACQDCHGDVNHRTLPFTRPQVPITMEFCTGCHAKKGVTTDCASCHR